MNDEISGIQLEVLTICCEEAIKNGYALFSAPFWSGDLERVADQHLITVEGVDVAVAALAQRGYLKKERASKPFLIHVLFKGFLRYLDSQGTDFGAIKGEVARALIGKDVTSDKDLSDTLPHSRWLIVAALHALQEERLLDLRDGQGNIQVRNIDSDILRTRYGQPRLS